MIYQLSERALFVSDYALVKKYIARAYKNQILLASRA